MCPLVADSGSAGVLADPDVPEDPIGKPPLASHHWRQILAGISVPRRRGRFRETASESPRPYEAIVGFSLDPRIAGT